MKRRDKIIRYQRHAEVRMQERGISKDQVMRTVMRPDSEGKAKRPGATRFEKALSRNKRLAVIAEESHDSVTVISAFWK